MQQKLHDLSSSEFAASSVHCNQETERPYMTGVTWIGNIPCLIEEVMEVDPRMASVRMKEEHLVLGILVYPGIFATYPTWGIETSKCVHFDTSI